MNVAVKHNGGDHVNEPSTATSKQKWGIFFLFGSGSRTLVGLERDFQLAIKLQQTNGIKVGISTRKGNNILIKMRGHVKGRAHELAATPNSSLGPAGKLHGDEEKHKRMEAATCSKAVKRELQDTAVTDSVAGWNGEGSTVKSLAHETPRRRGARRLMMDPAAAPCYTSSVKQQHSRYTSRVGVHVISGEACAEGRMKMESPLLSFAATPSLLHGSRDKCPNHHPPTPFPENHSTKAPTVPNEGGCLNHQRSLLHGSRLSHQPSSHRQQQPVSRLTNTTEGTMTQLRTP
ncbi:hypothetical protein LR48_Vigan03g178200 [Vigna angularis]|uniref:Uncharacterized protein n=1 Tax=Phaseolus angularis TaxID=3914 RepID=A0A0L9U6I3_PHAAN|nr:hypothetical protein LR48_Vigan03g178200 [Vigna angularis]